MIKSLTFVTLAISASLAFAQPALTRSTHTYKRVGDLEIKADVHRLDDTAVRPVVVWFHGGALIMGGRDRISKYLQQLVSDGIIVVAMARELKQHGVPHEFITIENAEHGFRDADPAKVEAAYQAAIAFTKRHLTGS